MNEKIILTVEQDEAIKSWKKQFGENNEKFIKRHVETKSGSAWWNKEFKCLTDLSVDQMARILYEPNSYEVEQPRINVGDWVTRTKSGTCGRSQFANGRTFKVTKVSDSLIVDDENAYHGINGIRHATKEEIIWAELGRDYRETKIGDCISLNGEYLKVQENMGCERYKNHISHLFAKGILISGHSDGFYPANSFIEFP